MKHNQAGYELKANLRRAGLLRIRSHDLRHAPATLMLAAGGPIPTASHILGHKNPTETLNRYAHVLDDMHEAAAERIDGYGFLVSRIWRLFPPGLRRV